MIRDRRRIDPETGRCARLMARRPGLPGRSTPPDLAAAELAAQVAERTADLQRITAEYANYRRRVDRDREAVLVNGPRAVRRRAAHRARRPRAGRRARRPHRPVQGRGRQDRLRGPEARPGVVRAGGRAVRPVGARGRPARQRATHRADGARCCPRVLRRGYRVGRPRAAARDGRRSSTAPTTARRRDHRRGEPVVDAGRPA